MGSPRILGHEDNDQRFPGALEKNTLSATDICLILDACSRSHARVLKFAGLEVEFGRSAETESLPLDMPAAPATLAEMAISDNLNTKAALEVDERKIREEQIEYLKITHPAEYERMIRDGELGEDDDSDAAGYDGDSGTA